jgi:predicted nucleic acid-binding protein
MVFNAVLDASVLYPLPLRDTLLRVAEAGLYEPCWSERILEEATSNLIADGRATTAQAQNMRDAMHGAFDLAAVPTDEIILLEPRMTNDPKDRHVLAAAVAGDAQVVVTLNLRDFPPAACEPFGIQPIHPGTFLLDLYSLRPDAVYEAIERQVSVLSRPPMTIDELLGRLAKTVPNFAQALQAHHPS